MAWYDDKKRLTYAATYENEKHFRKEMEAAAQKGWEVRNVTGIDSHINVGRTVTTAALTGGLSLLLGASRSKQKVTATYGRTQEWLEEHRQKK